MQMGEDLVIRILYPETNLPAMDDAITHWVNETVAEYQAECLGYQTNGDCGELTAEYESYLTDNRWISIQITGIFDKPYLAHPIDIIGSFHGDLSTGQSIRLEDLLVPSGYSILETMVATAAGVETTLIDEHFLDHWVLTSEGLEITLPRGTYLPMSEGTKVLFYPYAELEGILSFSGESVTVQVPSPVPTFTPPKVSTAPQTQLIDPTKPMVALTFDDGPGKHTSRLLDIFASYGGNGTFFVIGNILENRADVINRMVSEGHEIGGHSWDHRQLTKLNASDLNNQLTGTRTKIYELTGTDTALLRPPYGSYNSQVQNMCKDMGIVMVNWSLDTLDWKYKDADRLYHTIMDEVQDGDIILCHDLHGSTVDAMEKVIPELIARGYQLVTVSELLDQRGDVIEAGEVYYRGE
ncbi:MAG: polysaccharide deacetylase family protein [Lachnospiraceae bacterium]|nr:polysaccharide deacetylase family protein [Lachnospiraceae bacterium]